ncbi:MAG: PAS domain S-box protein, partial [Planctomycetales bacterium]
MPHETSEISEKPRVSRPPNFIFGRFTLGLAVIFACCAVLGYWRLARNHEQLVERTALQHAKAQATAIETFRKLYASEVVAAAQQAGLTVSHDYHDRENAIPLPATLSLTLAKELGEQESGSKTFLYSPYPFPWRAQQGGLRDEFSREAWARFSKTPDESFHQVENREGKRVLRYAKADRMRASCVNCHNTHPDSPKRDWKVGDARGVLEIAYPLDHAESLARDELRQTLAVLGSVFVAALFVVGIACAKWQGMLSAMWESEEQFRKLFENAPDANLLLMDGILIDCNQAALAMLGGTREQVIGMRPAALSPEFQPDGSRSDERAITIAREAMEAGSKRFEWVHRRFDGTDFLVEVAATAITYHGRRALFGTWRDVTDRKRAEEALRTLVQTSSRQFGEPFFESMALKLAEVLQADYTFIGEFQNDQGEFIQTVAVVADGKLADNFECDLKDTPCERVLEQAVCSYPSNVAEQFSQDALLGEMNVEAYVGVPLFTTSGEVLGILVAMYRSP